MLYRKFKFYIQRITEQYINTACVLDRQIQQHSAEVNKIHTSVYDKDLVEVNWFIPSSTVVNCNYQWSIDI
jgi:hypothetical protein